MRERERGTHTHRYIYIYIYKREKGGEKEREGQRVANESMNSSISLRSAKSSIFGIQTDSKSQTLKRWKKIEREIST